MNFLSLCSGIEAATVAWEPLGWKPVGFSEIDPFACALLEHHYPNVCNYGDMTNWKEWINELGSVDLICGGTPCQGFSLAGLRKGLDDDRSNLALEFLRIVATKRPKWIVWENVPGVLSTNKGRDFGTFLGGLEELGYGWAYRTLDAQYVRVDGFRRAIPQRRRRVFLVGYLGDWRPCAGVLFDPHSMSGYPPPSRTTLKGVTRTTETPFTTSSFGGFVEGVGTLRYNGGDAGGGSETLLAFEQTGARMVSFGEYVEDETASTIKERDYKGSTDLICVHGTQDPCVDNDVAFALGRNNGQENVIAIQANVVALGEKNRCNGCGWNDTGVAYTHDTFGVQGVAVGFNADQSEQAYSMGETIELSPSIKSNGQCHVATENGYVRRLTEVECERLMGFKDGYTAIPWKNRSAKHCPKGHRYRVLGNSWSVNVARWVGQRIDKMNKVLKEIEQKGGQYNG